MGDPNGSQLGMISFGVPCFKQHRPVHWTSANVPPIGVIWDESKASEIAMVGSTQMLVIAPTPRRVFAGAKSASTPA